LYCAWHHTAPNILAGRSLPPTHNSSVRMWHHSPLRDLCNHRLVSATESGAQPSRTQASWRRVGGHAGPVRTSRAFTNGSYGRRTEPDSIPLGANDPQTRRRRQLPRIVAYLHDEKTVHARIRRPSRAEGQQKCKRIGGSHSPSSLSSPSLSDEVTSSTSRDFSTSAAARRSTKPYGPPAGTI